MKSAYKKVYWEGINKFEKHWERLYETLEDMFEDGEISDSCYDLMISVMEDIEDDK